MVHFQNSTHIANLANIQQQPASGMRLHTMQHAPLDRGVGTANGLPTNRGLLRFLGALHGSHGPRDPRNETITHANILSASARRPWACKLDRLLDKIRNPPWFKRIQGADTDQRSGAVSDLKKHLRKTTAEQRSERDYALVGLRQVLVSDPPGLNFKDAFFEEHMMRLLARYLSPEVATNLPKLTLPPLVQDLHGQGEHSKIVSEWARMQILPPLLKASHLLHAYPASVLMAIAGDNLTNDKAIGTLEHRLTLLNAMVEAYLNNATNSEEPRHLLNATDCENLSEFAVAVTRTLADLNGDVNVNTYAPILDSLRNTLERFNEHLNDRDDTRSDDVWMQLSDAIWSIDSAIARLNTPPRLDLPPPYPDEPPSYTYADNVGVPSVAPQSRSQIAHEVLREGVDPEEEVLPTYAEAVRAGLAQVTVNQARHPA